MNNKSIIDTYSTVYDIDLVIANQHTTLEKLRRLYKYEDNSNLVEDTMIGLATTSLVVNKKTNRKSVLVKINKLEIPKDTDKKLELVNIAAHEAMHVLCDIYSHVGAEVVFNNQEPSAYFLGWITQNIYKTMISK